MAHGQVRAAGKRDRRGWLTEGGEVLTGDATVKGESPLKLT